MTADRKNGPNTGGRFGPGNPGKPRGARHAITRAVETLLDGQAEALTQVAIQAALAGDMVALRICMDRISPARKEPLVCFTLPVIGSPADIPAAQTAILQAVAAGELTPGEGSALVNMVGGIVKSFEAAEVEARLAALEAKST